MRQKSIFEAIPRIPIPFLRRVYGPSSSSSSSSNVTCHPGNWLHEGCTFGHNEKKKKIFSSWVAPHPDTWTSKSVQTCIWWKQWLRSHQGFMVPFTFTYITVTFHSYRPLLESGLQAGFLPWCWSTGFIYRSYNSTEKKQWWAGRLVWKSDILRGGTINLKFMKIN